MNRVLIMGGGGAGLAVARMLLEAAKVGCGASIIVAEGDGDSDAVLVRDEDGTTRVGTLTTDEAQMLVALRQPTLSQVFTLTARDLAMVEPGLALEASGESPSERKAHWQQSKFGSNRKFQSMQAKARRR